MTSIDQELKDLDRGWVAAYLHGDAELFNRIWTERFVFTFPFGQFTSREQEISKPRFWKTQVRIDLNG